MAFMDRSLDAPDEPDKGQENGSCNRRSCQAPNADWFNHGSLAWYCQPCAAQIGGDPVNRAGWMRDHWPDCQHPQFETRAMMDARKEPNQ